MGNLSFFVEDDSDGVQQVTLTAGALPRMHSLCCPPGHILPCPVRRYRTDPQLHRSSARDMENMPDLDGFFTSVEDLGIDEDLYRSRFQYRFPSLKSLRSLRKSAAEYMTFGLGEELPCKSFHDEGADIVYLPPGSDVKGDRGTTCNLATQRRMLADLKSTFPRALPSTHWSCRMAS